MDREGWLVEQVQDSGLQLTKFILYLYVVDSSFFLMGVFRSWFLEGFGHEGFGGISLYFDIYLIF